MIFCLTYQWKWASMSRVGIRGSKIAAEQKNLHFWRFGTIGVSAGAQKLAGGWMNSRICTPIQTHSEQTIWGEHSAMKWEASKNWIQQKWIDWIQSIRNNWGEAAKKWITLLEYFSTFCLFANCFKNVYSKMTNLH